MKKLLVSIFSSILVGGLAGVATSTFMMKRQEQSTATQKLVIVDKSGKPRALLTVDDQEQVSLDFLAPDSSRQLTVGVKKNMYSSHSAARDIPLWAPSIELLDRSGRRAALLTTVEHGNAVFGFYSPQSQWRLGMGYLDDGADFGIVGGMWGVRATKGLAETSLGILDHPRPNGDQYLAPVESDLHSKH